VGLPPVGETALAPMPGRVQGNFIAITFRVLGTGIRRPIFWVLCATFSICGLSSLGITQVHFVPFCTDSGVPQVTAASLLALIGVCDLIGTMASGWLSDRYDNRMLLGIYYALRGVALVWLVYGRPGLTSLSIFSVVFGLDFIATLPPTIKLSIAAFGRENGAAMLGWILAGHQMGAGLFAALAGISRDALHSYGPSFLAAGLACFAASICISLVRRPGEAGLRPAPARG
jgi:predicted MFS family arabinose efflux permease